MRAVVIALLATGCGRLAFDEGTPPDALGAARSTLRLDRILPGEPLVNVPVPITLDATRADLSRLRPDSFHAFIGTTELPVEIEAVGPPFVAWILVPSITDLSTSITVEYGGAAVSHAQVWDASYAGVWHMTGDGVDSSSFARASGVTALASQPGVIGAATTYSPALGSCIVVPSFESYSFNVATLSGWMFLDATAVSTYYTIITRQKADMVVDDFILGTDPSYSSLGVIDTLGSPTRIGSPVSLGAWHHFAYTYDGTASALYVDGTVVVSGAASGTPTTSARPVFIGCGRNSAAVPIDQADGDWVDGALDEVRFETVARSSAWLAYQVAAGRDEVITYGPVQ